MKRILLVDDDRDMANLTKLTLTIEGHEVIVCHDASCALEQTRKEIPDMILMDVMLPNMSGADAVVKLREIPGVSHIPIVFLTALVSTEEERGININGQNYKTLGKPYDIDQLLKVVDNFSY